MEALAFNGLTIAGKAFFAHAVYDSYGLIKDTAVHPAISAVINDLDLEADLQVIEALLKQIGHIDSEEAPLAISYHQVNEMVVKIKEELEKIKEKLVEHDEKYFSKWRTPDCVQQLENVRHYKQILDRRVSLMMKLIKLR